MKERIFIDANIMIKKEEIMRFKDKEDIAKYFESSSFNVEGGAYTGWQMKVGDVVGQEIFDFDLGLSSKGFIR